MSSGKLENVKLMINCYNRLANEQECNQRDRFGMNKNRDKMLTKFGRKLLNLIETTAPICYNEDRTGKRTYDETNKQTA